MSEEEAAIAELKAMNGEELLLVDFDPVKWVCAGKGCTRGKTIRDYGISPDYYWPGSKGRFINVLARFYLCSKHTKMWRRLVKNYDREKVYYKLCDPGKRKLEPINKNK